jgi:LytS/YehU family sensor histidine kinase
VTLDEHHPLAAYPAAAAIRSLLLALAAYAWWRLAPGAFVADLTGLLAGFTVATGVLWGGRRCRQPNVLAAVLAAALLAGAITAFAWQLLRQQGLPLPTAGWRAATAGLVLMLLILPQTGPRWLAWRERQVLAALAAQHAYERALLEARLAALQGQIEPHFLYNTLANVQYLLRRDATGADAMLTHLITYLRTTLPDMRQTEAPLQRELSNVRAYLDIMQIRMGERLRYTLDCPATLDHAMLPTLALATLVENALKHGLEPKPGGGSIEVVARQDGDTLQLSVSDDGVGFRETGGAGTGVGLRNLRDRLSTRFGEAAELRLEPGNGSGVIATMRLPLKFDEENHESERPDCGGRTAATRTTA